MAKKPASKDGQSGRFAALRKAQQEFREMVDGKRAVSRGVVTSSSGRFETVRVEKGKLIHA